MSELKPCPFCGAEHKNLMGYDYHKVGCSNIDCKIYGIAFEKDAWNARAPQSEWISVDDELPISIDDFHNFTNPIIGSLTKKVIVTDGKTSWEAEFYFWADNKVTGYDWICLGNVVAWQPLPTPPKDLK